MGAKLGSGLLPTLDDLPADKRTPGSTARDAKGLNQDIVSPPCYVGSGNLRERAPLDSDR